MATKAVTGGDLAAGGTVNYTITLTNNGDGVQPDNPGDEFTDTLPAGLTVASVAPVPGTTFVGNTVSWNGIILPGDSVVITITANIAGNASGTIINQGHAFSDTDRDLTTNETDTPTNSTPFDVVGGGPSVIEVPTLSEVGLGLLALMLSAAALLALRRRSRMNGA